MPWTELVELAVGALVVCFVAYGAAEGLLQLSEEDAVNERQFLYFVLGLLAIVLAVFVLIWLVNELDEETADAAARSIDVALGRGWERVGAIGRGGE